MQRGKMSLGSDMYTAELFYSFQKAENQQTKLQQSALCADHVHNVVQKELY